MNLLEEVWGRVRPQLVDIIENLWIVSARILADFLVFFEFILLLACVGGLHYFFPGTGIFGTILEWIHSTGMLVMLAITVVYTIVDLIVTRRGKGK